MKIAREIYSRIACEKNVQLYTPYPVDGVHLPVISFNIIGRAGEETAQLLDEKGYCLRGGYHCAPLAHKKFGTLDTGAAGSALGRSTTWPRPLAWQASSKSCSGMGTGTREMGNRKKKFTVSRLQSTAVMVQ